MATRIYLPHPSTGVAPAISPAFGSIWDKTDVATRMVASRTPSGSAMGNSTITKNNAGNPWDVLHAQYVVDTPLPAGVIPVGVLALVVRSWESNSGANAFIQMRVAVISPDGLTVRGELFSGVTSVTVGSQADNSDLENPTSTQPDTRHLRVLTTAVTAQAGDLLLIEIGNRHNSASTTFTGTLHLGDAAATDHTGALNLSTSARPYVEFTRNIFGYTNAPSADKPLYNEVMKDGPSFYLTGDDFAAPAQVSDATSYNRWFVLVDARTAARPLLDQVGGSLRVGGGTEYAFASTGYQWWWMDAKRVTLGGMVVVDRLHTATLIARDVNWQPIATRGWFLGVTATGALRFYGALTATTWFDVTTSVVLTPGVPIHFMAVYDGTDALVYVNGVLVGSQNAPGTLEISAWTVTLGRDGSPDPALEGRLDELYMYEHALTAARAAAHSAAALTTGDYDPDDPGAPPWQPSALDESPATRWWGDEDAPPQDAEIGQVSEAETPHALVPGSTVTVGFGQVSDTEVVHSLTGVASEGPQTAELGQVSDTEVPHALVAGGSVELELGQVQDVEVPHALHGTQSQTAEFGQVSETETPGSLTGVITEAPQSGTLGQVSDTETVYALTGLATEGPQWGAINAVSDTEQLHSLVPHSTVTAPIGQVADEEVLGALTPLSTVTVVLGSVVDTATPHSLVPRATYEAPIGQVSDLAVVHALAALATYEAEIGSVTDGATLHPLGRVLGLGQVQDAAVVHVLVGHFLIPVRRVTTEDGTLVKVLFLGVTDGQGGLLRARERYWDGETLRRLPSEVV